MWNRELIKLFRNKVFFIKEIFQREEVWLFILGRIRMMAARIIYLKLSGIKLGHHIKNGGNS